MRDTLLWLLLWRPWLRWRHRGFIATAASRVDRKSAFGEHVRLHGVSTITRSEIGSYSYVSGARVGHARIGKFCCIGPGAIVGGLGRHPTGWVSTHPLFYSTLRQVGINFVDQDHFDELPTAHLGNDVWIGANAIILDGVRIGDGAIIGAGAVVTRDVAPYQVCAGVPARPVRSRFPPAQVSTLLALRWWDWPESHLRAIPALMRSPGIDGLVDYAARHGLAPEAAAPPREAP